MEVAPLTCGDFLEAHREQHRAWVFSTFLAEHEHSPCFPATRQDPPQAAIALTVVHNCAVRLIHATKLRHLRDIAPTVNAGMRASARGRASRSTTSVCFSVNETKNTTLFRKIGEQSASRF